MGKGNKTKHTQYLLVGSINSFVCYINYTTGEIIYRFDMADYRQKPSNMLAYLAPYSENDFQLVLAVDKQGVCLINMVTSEVF